VSPHRRSHSSRRTVPSSLSPYCSYTPLLRAPCVAPRFDPYEDRYHDLMASVCQGQIFFSLLCSVALKYDPGTRSDASNLDVLLVVLWAMPILLAIFLLTPAPGFLEDAVELLEQHVGGRVDHWLMRSRQSSSRQLSILAAKAPNTSVVITGHGPSVIESAEAQVGVVSATSGEGEQNPTNSHV
jgi:hypothetical protein